MSFDHLGEFFNRFELAAAGIDIGASHVHRHRLSLLPLFRFQAFQKTQPYLVHIRQQYNGARSRTHYNAESPARATSMDSRIPSHSRQISVKTSLPLAGPENHRVTDIRGSVDGGGMDDLVVRQNNVTRACRQLLGTLRELHLGHKIVEDLVSLFLEKGLHRPV